MSEFIGGDLQRMADLHQRLTHHSNEIELVRHTVDQQLSGLAHLWRGNDASEFVARWQAEHRPAIAMAAEALQSAAAIVDRNRREQELTSATYAGGGGPGRWGGPYLPTGPHVMVPGPGTFGGIDVVVRRMLGQPGVDAAVAESIRTSILNGELDWTFLDSMEMWSGTTEFVDYRAEYLLEGSSTGEFGPGTYAVEGSFTAAARAHADGSASIGPNGAEFAASAEVGAYVGVDGRAEYSAGPIAAVATGTAMVGAVAVGTASGSIGKDGAKLHVGGEAFAGARARAEGQVSLGNSVSAGASAEGWVGVGVTGEADVDITFDEVTLDFELGAAIGIGGSVGVDLSFSPSGVVEDVSGFAGETVDAIGDGVEAVGRMWPF